MLRQIVMFSGYYTLSTTHNIALVVLITIIYTGVWVAIRKQRQRMQREGHNNSEIRKAIDVNVVSNKATIIAVFCRRASR